MKGYCITAAIFKDTVCVLALHIWIQKCQIHSNCKSIFEYQFSTLAKYSQFNLVLDFYKAILTWIHLFKACHCHSGHIFRLFFLLKGELLSQSLVFWSFLQTFSQNFPAFISFFSSDLPGCTFERKATHQHDTATTMFHHTDNICRVMRSFSFLPLSLTSWPEMLNFASHDRNSLFHIFAVYPTWFLVTCGCDFSKKILSFCCSSIKPRFGLVHDKYWLCLQFSPPVLWISAAPPELP